MSNIILSYTNKFCLSSNIATILNSSYTQEQVIDWCINNNFKAFYKDNIGVYHIINNNITILDIKNIIENTNHIMNGFIFSIILPENTSLYL